MYLELTPESIRVLRAGKTRSIVAPIAFLEKTPFRLEYRSRFCVHPSDDLVDDQFEVEILAHVTRNYGTLRLQIQGIGDMICGPIADHELAAVIWLRYAGECGARQVEPIAA